MGEAKRRKQLDPSYGQPAVFRLQIYDKQGEIAYVPFSVDRMAKQRYTDRRAQANAVLIFSVLQEPDLLESKQNLVKSMGEEMLAPLVELASTLPDRFWARLFTDDNQGIGDFATCQDDIDGEVTGWIKPHEVMGKAV
jgi:hypothetical protein